MLCRAISCPIACEYCAFYARLHILHIMLGCRARSETAFKDLKADDDGDGGEEDGSVFFYIDTSSLLITLY